MSGSNHLLLFLDLMKGLISIVLGNIGIPPLIRYLIGMMQPSFQSIITQDTLLVSAVYLLIAGYLYHIIKSKIIKAVVVICLFIPIILLLFSYFSVLKVPLPF